MQAWKQSVEPQDWPLHSTHTSHLAARAALLDAMGSLVDAAAAWTARDLAPTTTPEGWTPAELLVHVHLGLHRLLCGILTPTGHPVTAHDRCAYQPDAAIEASARQRAGHRRYVAGVTAAYADPREILDDLILTVDAASTGIVDLEPGALLVDGRPVCTGDFLDAWALEVNEHLCDFAQRTAGGAGC